MNLTSAIIHLLEYNMNIWRFVNMIPTYYIPLYSEYTFVELMIVNLYEYNADDAEDDEWGSQHWFVDVFEYQFVSKKTPDLLRHRLKSIEGIAGETCCA